MAADSPNDKRHVLVAFMRPTPICMATCRAIGGPLPTAIAAGKPWQRLHCLSCGGQHFQGLAITKAHWERWINGDDTELKGKPATH